MIHFKTFRSAACAAIFLGIFLPIAQAWAQPTAYTFAAASNPMGNLAIVNLLGSSAAISGSLMYDDSAPVSSSYSAIPFGYGSARGYGPPANSFSNLLGSVGSYTFSAPTGRTIVGNDVTDYPGRPPGQSIDWFALNADPVADYGVNTIDWTRPRDLSGFTIGGYTLTNVRLFWFTGIAGATDFLSSDSLPSMLPHIYGRVALDFVLTADPTNLANVPFYSNSVFFDGLTVQTASPIPEPETYAMLLAGLGLLGFHARRRKLKEAA